MTNSVARRYGRRTISPIPPPRSSTAAAISASSASMSASGWIRRSALRASAIRPLSRYQRAVSGMRHNNGNSSVAGAAASPNIARQPCDPANR